jgi:hypothetical protein
MINDSAFLLYIDEDHPFICLYTMLSTHLEEWITAGDIDLMRWTTEYGSIGCVVTRFVQLQITGLPCNLNSIPIVEYVLSPFASVEKSITVTDAFNSDLGNSVTTCRCNT